MENRENLIQTATDVDPGLLKILDRGIDDVKAGRTMPHKEAIAEVRRIRDERRKERKQGAAG